AVSAGLEHAWHRLETRLGEEHRAALLAEFALAYDRVVVLVGVERYCGVVGVQRAELRATDCAVELVDGLGQPLTGAHLIAGGEQVAGIQAHAEPLAAARRLQERRELLERAPEG